MTTYAGFRPPERLTPFALHEPGWRPTNPSPLYVFAHAVLAAGRCVCPVLVAAGRDGVVPTPARTNRLGRPRIGTSSACAGCGGLVA